MSAMRRGKRTATSMRVHPDQGRLDLRSTRTARSGQSRSFEERRKRRLIIGAAAGIIGFASWMFVVYKVSVMPSLALTEIRVYGADASVSSRVQAAAYSALSGSYLGIFNKANALLYSAAAISSAVARALPSAQTVSVGRDGMNTLTVTVSEKAPAAIVCAGLPNLDESGSISTDASQDCYFADDTGYIFKKVGSAPEAGFNVYYVPEMAEPAVGHHATSTALFADLQSFISGVKADGIATEGVLLKDGGEYELYIDNPDSSVAIVYFNDVGGFKAELTNLSAFWNTMARDKAKPPSFEYIDVRYGSNIFYRLAQ